MDEFALIAEYFAPLAAARPGAFGLTDDAAALAPPPGCETIVASDMLVAGVHFRAGDPPDTVAARALRANLSDLAAMGASPHGYLMALALPPELARESGEGGRGWAAAFAAQLARDQAEFGVGLLGGDTTATPGPLTVSIAALGFVEAGRALRRSGARPGDALYVSGTVGDAALALALPDAEPALEERFRRPEPRLALGRALVGVATAAIDISDGPVADIGHICRASGVAARLRAAAVPLSPAARARLRAAPELLETVLAGGDDYELAFAVPPARRAALAALPAPVTEIGVIEAGAGVTVIGADGAPMPLAREGWRHFARSAGAGSSRNRAEGRRYRRLSMPPRFPRT